MAIGSDSGGRVPPLHLVTDRELVGEAGFASRAAALLQAGGPAVALHLRAGGLAARILFEAAERLVAVAASTGSTLVVNDRLDVALAAGAGGIHLGATSFRPDEVRRWVGEGRMIGASVHSVAEAVHAVAAGADFLIAGTIFSTLSHPGRAGSGPAWLADAAALGRPVIAIGGIAPERVASVLRAGAAGVAVQRGIWGAARPESALREYLSALGENQA